MNERYEIFLAAYPNEIKPDDKKFKNHLPYIMWINKKKKLYLKSKEINAIIDHNDFTNFLRKDPK